MNEPDKAQEPSELLSFPGSFEVKAVGVNSTTFKEAARAILEPSLARKAKAIQSINSRNGKYVSLRAEIYAEDRAALEAIYAALKALDETKFLL